MALLARTTLFFDAVDLLIPACQLQYSRMREAAADYSELQNVLSELPDGDDDAERLRNLSIDVQTVLIADSGSFVATVQRLRRVVNRLRGYLDIPQLAQEGFRGPRGSERGGTPLPGASGHCDTRRRSDRPWEHSEAWPGTLSTKLIVPERCSSFQDI